MNQNTSTWTNLGTMYLMHNDHELASQAFSRAQANSPENSAVWLGQAMLTARRNNPAEASQLFQHAFDIAEVNCVCDSLIKLI